MEPDIREFLVKIMQSVSMCIVWFLINISFGIYYGYAFFEKSPSLGNILYYIGFLISLTMLILYFRKKWKGWKEINE